MRNVSTSIESRGNWWCSFEQVHWLLATCVAKWRQQDPGGRLEQGDGRPTLTHSQGEDV